MSKIRHLLCLLFLSFIFYQCCERKEQIIFDSLQGDWVSSDSSYLFLTFKDSLYNTTTFDGNIFRKFNKYSIVNNKLTLKEYNYKKDAEFEIVKVSDKVLRLNTIDKELNNSKPLILRNSKENYANTFTLEKLEVMFEYPGQRMLFSIDTTKTGFVKYWIYNKKSAELFGWPDESGSYKISFTPQGFDLIQDKVRIIPFGDIQNKSYRDFKNLYHVNIKSIIYIKLKANEIVRRVETSANNVIGYPCELSLLYSYLFHINIFFKLEKTDEEHAFEIKYSKLRPYFLKY